MKKLKKYKKILKHKDEELNSLCHYAMGESMVNDIGAMFQISDGSRRISFSSNAPRYPRVDSGHSQGLSNYLHGYGSKIPSYVSTPKQNPFAQPPYSATPNISQIQKSPCLTSSKIILETSQETNEQLPSDSQYYFAENISLLQGENLTEEKDNIKESAKAVDSVVKKFNFETEQ